MLKKILQSVVVSASVIVATTLMAATAAPVDTKATDKANNIFTDETQSFGITSEKPEFAIKLKSNPTTGFSWYLREYDKNLITPVKHDFIKPSTKLMGAPGYEVWTFRVKPAGFIVPQQTMLRMVYARPWQSDSSTQVVFKISTSR